MVKEPTRIITFAKIIGKIIFAAPYRRVSQKFTPIILSTNRVYTSEIRFTIDIAASIPLMFSGCKDPAKIRMDVKSSSCLYGTDEKSLIAQY
jgi:hypothetical protein